MTVMVCPACGAEYVASVAVCADDGTLLVESEADEMEAEIAEDVARAEDREKADLDGEEVDDESTGDQVAYELGEWDNQSRVLLDQLLVGAGIHHVWEVGTLVIRTEDEDRTDELVEQVEVTTQPLLDPDKDQVVYDLDGWPDEKRSALADSLGEADIPFGFDENDDLVVHEEDEEKITPVLDQVDFNFSVDGDAIAEDDRDDAVEEADGLEVQDTLSDLFVASDRLLHGARDKDGVLGLVRGAEAVARYALPYGFAPGTWAEIVERSGALRALLEGEPADADGSAVAADDEGQDVDDEVVAEADADGEEGDDAESDDDDDVAIEALVQPTEDEVIAAAARELRELLRQYV